LGDQGIAHQLAIRDRSILGRGETMNDISRFADRQLELAAEFAQYIAEHPQVDSALPEKSHICFQIEGDADFNRTSQELAEQHRRDDGVPVILVRIKGLEPPHGSRLIDPVIEPAAAVA
jgi:hypothetical protein